MIDRSEGDTNLTGRRRAWAGRAVGPETERWLKADAGAFLHQALSTPCLDVIVRAEGLWLESLDGRRYMDFHGNNVHHVGHGHPRVKAAIRRQLDELPFVPRRFTGVPAIRLAETIAGLAPAGLDQVLFSPGGQRRHRDGAQAGPRRHRALQDGLLLGRLPRGGLRRYRGRR